MSLGYRCASIDQKGFAYIRVHVESKSGIGSLEYKVDSGASRTTINIEALLRLGYTKEWVKNNGTLLTDGDKPLLANNMPIEDCYIVTLPGTYFGGYRSEFWKPLVLLHDSYQFRLLLGVDIMRYFLWQFDYAESLCYFKLNEKMVNQTYSSPEESSIGSLMYHDACIT